jgi:hypothetical protein
LNKRINNIIYYFKNPNQTQESLKAYKKETRLPKREEVNLSEEEI